MLTSDNPYEYAKGGRISTPSNVIKGKGTGTSDSIQRDMPVGSFIIPAAVVREHGAEKIQRLIDSYKANIPREKSEPTEEKATVKVSNGEMQVPPEIVKMTGTGMWEKLVEGVTGVKPKGGDKLEFGGQAMNVNGFDSNFQNLNPTSANVQAGLDVIKKSINTMGGGVNSFKKGGCVQHLAGYETTQVVQPTQDSVSETNIPGIINQLLSDKFEKEHEYNPAENNNQEINPGPTPMDFIRQNATAIQPGSIVPPIPSKSAIKNPTGEVLQPTNPVTRTSFNPNQAFENREYSAQRAKPTITGHKFEQEMLDYIESQKNPRNIERPPQPRNGWVDNPNVLVEPETGVKNFLGKAAKGYIGVPELIATSLDLLNGSQENRNEYIKHLAAHGDKEAQKLLNQGGFSEYVGDVAHKIRQYAYDKPIDAMISRPIANMLSKEPERLHPVPAEHRTIMNKILNANGVQNFKCGGKVQHLSGKEDDQIVRPEQPAVPVINSFADVASSLVQQPVEVKGSVNNVPVNNTPPAESFNQRNIAENQTTPTPPTGTGVNSFVKPNAQEVRDIGTKLPEEVFGNKPGVYLSKGINPDGSVNSIPTSYNPKEQAKINAFNNQDQLANLNAEIKGRQNAVKDTEQSRQLELLQEAANIDFRRQQRLMQEAVSMQANINDQPGGGVYVPNRVPQPDLGGFNAAGALSDMQRTGAMQAEASARTNQQAQQDALNYALNLIKNQQEMAIANLPEYDSTSMGNLFNKRTGKGISNFVDDRTTSAFSDGEDGQSANDKKYFDIAMQLYKKNPKDVGNIVQALQVQSPESYKRFMQEIYGGQ